MGNNDKSLGMSGGVPAGELLPCPNPWCERIEGVEASQQLATERWHVCCDDCMIEGPWAKTYDEAVVAWNTRATPTPPIEGRDADVERVALIKRLEDAKWTYAGAKQDVCSIDPDDIDAVIAALQALGERP